MTRLSLTFREAESTSPISGLRNEVVASMEEVVEASKNGALGVEKILEMNEDVMNKSMHIHEVTNNTTEIITELEKLVNNYKI